MTSNCGKCEAPDNYLSLFDVNDCNKPRVWSVAVDGRVLEFSVIGLNQLDGSVGDVCISDLLFDIYDLRYKIYVLEKKLNSKYANHIVGHICDDLDKTATQIICRSEGKLVGCVRLNMARDGNLGEFEGLYNMKSCNVHPGGTGITTKLMVLSDWRGMRIDLLLVNIATAISIKCFGVFVNFMDCALPLVKYYRRLGFRQCGDRFVHYETGSVVPMYIDVADQDWLKRCNSPLANNCCVTCAANSYRRECRHASLCAARNRPK